MPTISTRNPSSNSWNLNYQMGRYRLLHSSNSVLDYSILSLKISWTGQKLLSSKHFLQLRNSSNSSQDRSGWISSTDVRRVMKIHRMLCNRNNRNKKSKKAEENCEKQKVRRDWSLNKIINNSGSCSSTRAGLWICISTTSTGTCSNSKSARLSRTPRRIR